MAVYEIEFRLQHDCPYNNLSRKYPNLVGWMYTTWNQDFKNLESYGNMCGFGSTGTASSLLRP